MSKYPVTPHIKLLDEIGFGKTVLMPGDPLRAKFIAENYDAWRTNPLSYFGSDVYKNTSLAEFATEAAVASSATVSFSTFSLFSASVTPSVNKKRPDFFFNV